MKKLFISLLVLIAVLGCFLIYLGFVPGISPLIAKPIDLGIKPDSLYTQSLEEKLNFKNELPNGIVPPGRTGIFSGQIQVDEQVSSVAATSILSHWKNRSPSLPIRNVQVRFNKDGTAEVSGILETATAISIAKTLGYNDQDIEEGKSYLKYISGDLPFYVRGTASVSNNQVSISPTGFQLGKVTVPDELTKQASKVVEDIIERRLKQVPSIDLETVSQSSDMLLFKGKVPGSIK